MRKVFHYLTRILRVLLISPRKRTLGFYGTIECPDEILEVIPTNLRSDGNLPVNVLRKIYQKSLNYHRKISRESLGEWPGLIEAFGRAINSIRFQESPDVGILLLIEQQQRLPPKFATSGFDCHFYSKVVLITVFKSESNLENKLKNVNLSIQIEFNWRLNNSWNRQNLKEKQMEFKQIRF